MHKLCVGRFWQRTCLGVAPMLNGPFIGGGHGVWRPILVCLPPHRVHSCRAKPCRKNRTNLTKYSMNRSNHALYAVQQCSSGLQCGYNKAVEKSRCLTTPGWSTCLYDLTQQSINAPCTLSGVSLACGGAYEWWEGDQMSASECGWQPRAAVRGEVPVCCWAAVRVLLSTYFLRTGIYA
jgi:hypothetical protein